MAKMSALGKEETVKKRGGHTRQRKYPGVKGRRPDKAAKRQAAACATREAQAERKEAVAHAGFVAYEKSATS